MEILIGLIIFVLGYVVAKFILGKVPPIAELVEVLALAIGALLAFLYMGVI